MTPGILPAAAIACAAVSLGWAAVSDIRRYLIPNTASVLIASAYLALACGQPVAFLVAGSLTGFAVLAVGIFLFSRGWMGGGDVKLLAAMALWAGPGLLSTFTFATCVAGAILGLLMLTPFRRLMPPAPTRPVVGLGNGGVPAGGLRQPMPFGVAIALGGVYILFLQLPLVR